MLTDAEIAGMRAASASALPDVGTITRPSEGGTLDPVTGIFSPTAATTVYTGAMRVRPPSATEMESLFGDTQVTTQRYVATLPHDAALPAIDDRLSVTTSSDSEIGAAEFRVTVVPVASWQLDRRIGLEVVT